MRKAKRRKSIQTRLSENKDGSVLERLKGGGPLILINKEGVSARTLLKQTEDFLRGGHSSAQTNRMILTDEGIERMLPSEEAGTLAGAGFSLAAASGPGEGMRGSVPSRPSLGVMIFTGMRKSDGPDAVVMLTTNATAHEVMMLSPRLAPIAARYGAEGRVCCSG
jgi:hypothetical protein